jgi:uncharacterized integral membrane protein
MKVKLIAAYTGATVVGLILAAAILLAMLQWGNGCEFSVYGKNVTWNTAGVILGAALAGWLIPLLVKFEFRWMGMIHRHRRETKALEEAVQRAAPKPAAPSAPVTPAPESAPSGE